MITQSSIDNLKSHLDIVGVVDYYLELKKNGANFVACCPFHEEDTPSFVVSPSKEIFNCFGCGEGGDAIKFVMKHENFTYPEALEKLADMHGITLEHEDGSQYSPNVDNFLPDENQKRIRALGQTKVEPKEFKQYSVESFKKVDEYSNEAKAFLRDRGILHIPENAYEIEISHEFQRENDLPFSIITKGICLPMGDITNKDITLDNIKKHGVDIHLYRPFTNKFGVKTKSQTFGNKDITLIADSHLNVFSPFESKMDYFSCNNLKEVRESSVIIANGISQIDFVISSLKKEMENRGLREEDVIINHYNQNDLAGYEFNAKLALAFSKAQHTRIAYQNNEHGFDINDLVEKGVEILDRRKRTSVPQLLLKQLEFKTKKVITTLVDTKKEKADKLMYVFKNMHKFYENDVPLSNLLISSSVNFITKQDIRRQVDFKSLKEKNVYLNRGTEGTYLYKKEFYQGKEHYRAVKHFDITQTNLIRNKDAKDAFEPSIYYANSINDNDIVLELIYKNFNERFNDIVIDNDLKNNQEKLLNLFKQVTSKYIKDEDMINVISFVMYSRVDYKSVELFNEELETSLLSFAKDENYLRMI